MPPFLSIIIPAFNEATRIIPSLESVVAYLKAPEPVALLAPPHLYALAVCGGVKLDFRGARLTAGVTRVTALACMGGIDIIVPPGLSVVVSGLGVLGGVDHLERESGDGPGAARLQVTAFACMGGVGVTTRPSERAEAATPQRLRRRS